MKVHGVLFDKFVRLQGREALGGRLDDRAEAVRTTTTHTAGKKKYQARAIISYMFCALYVLGAIR